jgi:HK97 family phage major capsid protein
MKTIFQMKQHVSEVGAELRTISEEIRTKAADPSVGIEEVRSLKQKKTDTEERFNMLKEELRAMEEAEAKKLKQQNPLTGIDSDEKRMIAAKADLIRSAILGRQPSEETRNLLAAIPANHASGGAKFLPTNMTNELVHEPFAKNQLREVANVSNIKGLEIPKISFTLDDDAFITDEQTAKEIALTGDKVSFGRNKFKVKARISDTVLHGSDLDLVNYVENALRSGLAAKEKKDALATAPTAGLEHMSFYTAGQIKEVTGEDLYTAITEAIADLPEEFAENAKIMMKRSDYLKILKTLSNGTTNFHNTPAEQVLGKPVEFTDAAAYPIVGDFNYFRINYDGELVYDTDKDVDKGEYLFVLTAWYDQKRSLNSAFRIAKVAPVV